MNYASTYGSLNFGMIIVDYFLVTPKFIQFCLNTLVDSACTTPLGRLFRILTTLLVKKRIYVELISCTSFFCNFKSLPQVVSMVDVVKFGTATMSYLSYNIL